MTLIFSQPSSGAWLKPADTEGHLILIVKVHEISPRYDNYKADDVDTATVDYVDLDEPGQPLHSHANNAHPGIVKKLSSALRSGEAVLGRIGKVPTDKGNPAWVLAPYDENGTDAQRATTWIEQRNRPRPPAQPQATPTAPIAPQTPVPAPAPVPAAPPPPARSTSIDVSTLTDEQRAKLAALGIS